MSQSKAKRMWRVGIICLSLCAAMSFETIAESSDFKGKENERREKAVQVLREVLQKGQEWERVHAAEALLWNGYAESVKEVFQPDSESAGPPYRIGIWRVLARSQGNDETAARRYVQKILKVFLDPLATDREYALEALAKLQFDDALPEVVRVAQEGAGGLRVYARWVLANSGDLKQQSSLAELLDSSEPAVRANAAYALRHLKKLQSSTLAKVKTALSREPFDSPAKTYELGALYVH